MPQRPKRKRPNDQCPCGTGLKYARCCQPLHSGELPKSPESLMRSRFSAYAKGLLDYIIETTDPSGPMYHVNHNDWTLELQKFCDQTRFVSLTVQEATGDHVTFSANLVQNGTMHTMREKSLFTKPNERWLYHSGEEF